ncbi:MAG: Gfo/Idh/MocA family oxidoreductase [Candidatus Pacearchaeota archaeon]
MKKIKVAVVGLGTMGGNMVKTILNKKDIEFVGGIVRREEQNGKDVAEIIGLKKKTGAKAYTNPKELFKKKKPDVILQATVSYAKDAWKQIKPAVLSGINVVTIAEEMNYPAAKYPSLAKEIDKLAKKHKVSVIGTGTNPGFAMDFLPLVLSGTSKKINSMKIVRFKDPTASGPAVTKNMGIGLSLKDFKKGVKNKKLPLHIGLPESAHILAKGLYWKIDKVKETRKPVTAEKEIKIPGIKIKKGDVSGFDQKLVAFHKGKKIISIEERGRVGPNVTYQNEIILEGEPKIREMLNVPPTKIVTSSHAVNMIPIAVDAKPGLLCMVDLPPATALPEK